MELHPFHVVLTVAQTHDHGAGARFGIAGLVLIAVLALQRGFAAVRPTRAQLAGAALVGLLLPGANAVVSVAEQEVPSSIAALLIASVPLWVILLRAGSGDRVSLRGAASVLVGFAGVALLAGFLTRRATDPTELPEPPEHRGANP